MLANQPEAVGKGLMYVETGGTDMVVPELEDSGKLVAETVRKGWLPAMHLTYFPNPPVGWAEGSVQRH